MADIKIDKETDKSRGYTNSLGHTMYALDLLDESDKSLGEESSYSTDQYIKLAHVHAMLAVAAAVRDR